MIQILLFLLGLGALIAGAEMLVRGAARLAVVFGLSPLVVGLTVVAFGTSSPELAVSVQSAYSGRTDIAVGNVVGSNIFNVLLILGLAALIAPLLVSRQVVRQEVPAMIAISVLLFGLAADGSIVRWEAGLMLVLLIAYTAFLVSQGRRAGAAGGDDTADIEQELRGGYARHWSMHAGLIVAGLVLLIAGSGWLVEAAVQFARDLGVSELIVGLTIVAAGTSAPELATSVLATIRGHRDIAVGNVIGSNIFNILGVLGLSGMVAPAALSVAPSVIAFDLPVMTAVAVACLPILFTGYRIARWEGAVFVGYYAAYMAYLILDATGHDALRGFSTVMMLYVIPLTLVTLAVVVYRSLRAG
jgi:cation:H+ antiporter